MNNIYNIFHCLDILYAKTLYTTSFIILSVIYHKYLFCLYQSMYDEYVKFHDRTSVSIKEHINPLNNNRIFIPLDYKIYDIKYTIFKIVIYFCSCVLPFAILRYLRLGTEINLLQYINILSSIPFIVNIILVCNLIHLLYVIGIFFLNVYTRLYKELKKLYIYLVQFGGSLDSSYSGSSKEPYIYSYLLNPINEYTLKKLRLVLYTIIENLQNNYSNNKYIYNKKVSSYIIRLLLEIKLLLPFIYNILFYLSFFIAILFEIYSNNFVIKHLFYVLFFMFIYKQIYNLAYFSWYHNIIFDKSLALYYYKLSDLMKYDKNGHSLRLFYNVVANYKQNDRLLYYLNTGLNLYQAEAFMDKKKWPEYPYIYIIVKNQFRKFIKKITRYIIYIKNKLSYIYKLLSQQQYRKDIKPNLKQQLFLDDHKDKYE